MKLSIIIPTYNVEKYIERTINSLIAQTEKLFEVIIIDDGSTDNTLKVIEKILNESNLNNFRVVKKPNGGVSSARNKGMLEASGQYIMFLDGDDYVTIDLIENIYENIDNKASDIFCWEYDKVDENSAAIKSYKDFYNSKYIDMTGMEALTEIICNQNMWIWTGSAVYKKELLMKYNIKYTEGCSNGEDQEFTIKALARAGGVTFINKTLSFYVQREASISNCYNIKRFDAVDAMKRTYKYIEDLDNGDFKLICEKIKNDNVVENYVSNFVSCFGFIFNSCKSKKESFIRLYNDIEKNYHNLNKEVAVIIKNYHSKNLLRLIKYKLFLISPLIYIWIFSLKNKK